MSILTRWSHLVGIGILSLASIPVAGAFSLEKFGDPVRMAPGGGSSIYKYSYAPTIMKTQGSWHAWYCSAGPGTPGDWDHVRYVNGSALDSWNPGVADLIQPNPYERAACDPSVVRFDAGDGLYYYMAYSGNLLNVQTVNFMARAKEPWGPYEKLSEAGNWEAHPARPKIIARPKVDSPEGSKVYGAGQPALVVKDGTIYQWFTDTTAEPMGIYLSKSTNMKDWSKPVYAGLDWRYASVDVKYFAAEQIFVMVVMPGSHTADSHVDYLTSKDGLNWSEPVTFCDTNCNPDFAHNVGINGDENGHIIGDELLIGYGAPPGLAKNDVWAQWELYGQRFRINYPGKIKGYVERVATNPATIDGWACGMERDESIEVHAYVGGPAGTGTMLGGVLANRASEPSVAEACKAGGTAYRFSIPLTAEALSKYAGGAIYVHGLSKVGGPNDVITNSGNVKLPDAEGREVAANPGAGSTVTAPPAGSDTSGSTAPPAPTPETVVGGKVTGLVDGLTPDLQLRGWACNLNVDKSIAVHLYAGGPAGVGSFVLGAPANVTSEPAVAEACQAHGTAYRFMIPMTNDIVARFAGQPLFVYGISATGSGNEMLTPMQALKVPATASSAAPTATPSAPVAETPATPAPTPVAETPATSPTPVADASTPAQEAAPALRYYNPNTGEHFYTTSREEGSAAPGFVFEGTGFRTLASGSGSAPTKTLYRCYDGRTHYISGDAKCEGAGKKEGDYGAVYANHESGTIALYRLYNAVAGRHLVTSNPAEIESAKAGGYEMEGNGQPLGYVLPPID